MNANCTAPVFAGQCKLCGGLGMIGYDVEVLHAAFGKLHPCPDCRGMSGSYGGHKRAGTFGSSNGHRSERVLDGTAQHAGHVAADADAPQTAAQRAAVVKASTRWRVHTDADADSNAEPAQWIVEGLFGAGTVNIVYGDSGSGKTWAMLDLAVCVAMGTPWLGRVVERGAVHYVYEDTGARNFPARLQACKAGHAAPAELGITYTLRAGVNICDRGDVLKELAALVEVAGARLVVIDTFINAARDVENENDALQVARVFQLLGELAQRSGAAVVVLDHANKSGGYRGSTAKKGAVDCMVEVSSSSVPGNAARIRRITFKLDKARDAEAHSLHAMAHLGPGTFSLRMTLAAGAAADAASDTAAAPQAQAEVLDYLQAHGASTAAAIAGAYTGRSLESTRNAVNKLVRHEKVRRADGGKRGVVALYELCS